MSGQARILFSGRSDVKLISEADKGIKLTVEADKLICRQVNCGYVAKATNFIKAVTAQLALSAKKKGSLDQAFFLLYRHQQDGHLNVKASIPF